MIRAHVLISGDALSLARGAEETRLAIEAELSYLGLDKEVQVSYMGHVDRTDALPMVIVFPEGTRYGAVRPEDGAYIVQEHLYKGRIAQHLLAPPETLSGQIAHLPGRDRKSVV